MPVTLSVAVAMESGEAGWDDWLMEIHECCFRMPWLIVCWESAHAMRRWVFNRLVQSILRHLLRSPDGAEWPMRGISTRLPRRGGSSIAPPGMHRPMRSGTRPPWSVRAASATRHSSPGDGPHGMISRRCQWQCHVAGQPWHVWIGMRVGFAGLRAGRRTGWILVGGFPANRPQYGGDHGRR